MDGILAAHRVRKPEVNWGGIVAKLPYWLYNNLRKSYQKEE
jgi:hypothetical protein